jgi:hypothetical protein
MTISVQFGHELVNESTRCDVELLFAVGLWRDLLRPQLTLKHNDRKLEVCVNRMCFTYRKGQRASLYV